jgi:hypothetical protein
MKELRMLKTTQWLHRSIERWVSRCFSRQVLLNVGTLVAVALMLGAYHAWAAPGPAPQPQAASNASTGLLSYQGYLTDAGGEPLHGDVDVTFRLYSVLTEGTALWTEAHTGENAVPVTDGLFNVMLGSLTPIPDDVWSSGARYLGIQIGDDAEMTPREMIGNVPTALTVPDGSISSSKLGSDVHLLRIESGKENHTYYDSEWILHEGEGWREYVTHITFGLLSVFG